MELDVQTFWLQRQGHAPEAFEDAFAGPVRHPEGWCLAIADGATETVYAGLWARMLVEAFTEAPGEDWLARARRRWQTRLPKGRQVPWYVEEKMMHGAWATFLGVFLYADGHLQAFATGDCCLLHYRHNRQLSTWPVEHAEAFSHRPDLLSSSCSKDVPALLQYQSRCEPGDRLVLATDALASCLMQDRRTPRWPDESAFAQWVQRARVQGTLRNDDVTCMIVTIL